MSTHFRLNVSFARLWGILHEHNEAIGLHVTHATDWVDGTEWLWVREVWQ